MADLLYRKYGVEKVDPSAMQTGIAAQKTNLSEVMAGVKGLMENQERQYIQQNTQQAQDALKQAVQQQGISILDNPLDISQQLRPYGNMIDQAAVTKTVGDETNIMKNNFINKISGEADQVMRTTGDPIAAREHFNKAMVAGGAGQVFADSEAVNYDTRKAPEIKNIGIRDAQALDTAIAKVMEAGKTGYQNMKSVADAEANSIAPHKRADFKTKITKSIEDISKPTEYDSTQMNSALAAYKAETAANLKALLENNQQRNDQKVNFSSASSSGSESGTTRKHKDGSDNTTGGVPLIDAKGKVNPSTAVALGNHVTNLLERFSSTNDAAMIKAIHKDVFDAVGSEEAASSIIGQSFRYAYKGDRLLGNDLSAKDLEAMKTKANELVQAHSQKSSGTSTSHSSSSSRGGNISFTNADAITKYVSERQRGEQSFTSKLMEAARNNKLGVTDYDAVQRTIDDHLRSNTIPATTPPSATTAIMNIKAAGPAGNKNTTPADTTTAGAKPMPNNNAKIDAELRAQGINPNQAKGNGKETATEKLARYAKEEAEAKAAANKSKETPTATPASTSTSPAAAFKVESASYKKSESPIVNMFRWAGSGGVQKAVDKKYAVKK